MDEPVTLHTSTIGAAAPPPAPIAWWADDETTAAHAFPRRDGFPPPAVCGIRWSVRYGNAGAGFCVLCVAELRTQLEVVTAALAVVDAVDDRGNHFAGMPG